MSFRKVHRINEGGSTFFEFFVNTMYQQTFNPLCATKAKVKEGVTDPKKVTCKKCLKIMATQNKLGE